MHTVCPGQAEKEVVLEMMIDLSSEENNISILCF